MIQSGLRFKTNLAFLLATEIEAIDHVLFDMMPAVKFGFISFEDDDFETCAVSYFLLEKMPDCVFVTISKHSNLDTAMQLLENLNAHIRWERVGVSFASLDDQLNETQTLELRLLTQPVYVNAGGELIM